MKTEVEEPAPELVDRLFEIEGLVQGVGFRPFVARAANRHAVRGWVRNDGRGVTLRAVGTLAAVEALMAELRAHPPAAARITAIKQSDLAATPAPPAGAQEFTILESEPADELTTAVVPDLALCPDCRRELADPGDRRHAYPFINCTNCGPRYSVIEALPYDRERTTMRRFVPCPDCAREFGDATSRRFHAQANACPVCGPHVDLRDRHGQVLATRAGALAAAARALRDGLIVAVKGLGGFHLMADATNAATVNELRRHKHREEKPLAVMFPDLAALQSFADVTADEAAWLSSSAAPIVLVRRRPGVDLAEAVAPGNPWIGALLPYTPLHVLLLEAAGRPLIATSGNLSEEPLCSEDAEARERLGDIADYFLGHDRPIARQVDDSLVRQAGHRPLILRRARGFAPAPIPLPSSVAESSDLLCVGGQMKNTVAITVGRKLVLSQHLGDLANPISVTAFRHAVEWLRSLHGGRFERVACDAHPDYASTQFAESLGLPVVHVQHHLAHILSCLLEYDGGPPQVLGVAWDGTGHGPDGTVWGGEFIVVDRAARAATRIAHLRPFRLPGGEAAVREPRRTALALAYDVYEGDRAQLEPLADFLGFTRPETDLLLKMLGLGLHAPVTTSAGRLFDGVAALLGLRTRSTFEGQAAMEVEFAAESWTGAAEPWPMTVATAPSGAWTLDWRPMIASLIEQRRCSDRGCLSARFHASLAASIEQIVHQCGLGTVALSGGCFQNVRLLEAATTRLESVGCTVLRHRDLPPNDGGLSAGQALGALWGIADVNAWPGTATAAHQI